MASTKRKKFNENCAFKEEWIEKYAFILFTSSSNLLAYCLVCSQNVALVKSSNLKCHYETKHSEVEEKCKQGREERKKQISLLKSPYEKSTMVCANTMNAQEKATEC